MLVARYLCPGRLPSEPVRDHIILAVRPAHESDDSRMKEKSIPVFLETANPRNVDIYKKKGFKIFETVIIGDCNLVLMSSES